MATLNTEARKKLKTLDSTAAINIAIGKDAKVLLSLLHEIGEAASEVGMLKVHVDLPQDARDAREEAKGPKGCSLQRLL